MSGEVKDTQFVQFGERKKILREDFLLSTTAQGRQMEREVPNCCLWPLTTCAVMA